MNATGNPAADIAAVQQRFLQFFANKDLAGLAGCYTEDAQMMVANMDVISGRGAIASVFKFTAVRGHTLDFEDAASSRCRTASRSRSAAIPAGATMARRSIAASTWWCGSKWREAGSSTATCSAPAWRRHRPSRRPERVQAALEDRDVARRLHRGSRPERRQSARDRRQAPAPVGVSPRRLASEQVSRAARSTRAPAWSRSRWPTSAPR